MVCIRTVVYPSSGLPEVGKVVAKVVAEVKPASLNGYMMDTAKKYVGRLLRPTLISKRLPYKARHHNSVMLHNTPRSPECMRKPVDNGVLSSTIRG
jgi:hypothetical protein